MNQTPTYSQKLHNPVRWGTVQQMRQKLAKHHQKPTRPLHIREIQRLLELRFKQVNQRRISPQEFQSLLGGRIVPSFCIQSQKLETLKTFHRFLQLRIRHVRKLHNPRFTCRRPAKLKDFHNHVRLCSPCSNVRQIPDHSRKI